MATSKSGTKKSLFKKPTWATTTSSTSDENVPIFGQSHLYQEILQNEKERRERHAAKQKAKDEKVRAREVNKERETKRRRISNEAEDSDYGSGSDSRSVRSGSVDSQRSQKLLAPLQNESTRTLRSTPTKRKEQISNDRNLAQSPLRPSSDTQPDAEIRVIVLDDDDNDYVPGQSDQAPPTTESTKRTSKPGVKSRPKDSDPESEEEDEYLRELKSKARQEARSKRLGIGTQRKNTSDSPTRQRTSQSHSPVAEQQPQVVNKATSIPAAEDETEVQIYISTIIPNAKPVIVNRKIGQPLDKVKEYWIRHNKLDPAIATKVFFTWNNTRLYNSTTMRGIIERLKRTHPRPDGSDPSDGKIMIEAVTDEIFEYRLQQKARRQAEDAASDQNADSQNPESTNDNNAATNEEDTQPQNNGIVIKLKAQESEDLSIRVRPNSTMRKIVSAFCKLKKIDMESHSQVWLSYDGDRLAEDTTVEEVGFEHEDTVEVYFK